MLEQEGPELFLGFYTIRFAVSQGQFLKLIKYRENNDDDEIFIEKNEDELHIKKDQDNICNIPLDLFLRDYQFRRMELDSKDKKIHEIDRKFLFLEPFRSLRRHLKKGFLEISCLNLNRRDKIQNIISTSIENNPYPLRDQKPF